MEFFLFKTNNVLIVCRDNIVLKCQNKQLQDKSVPDIML